ncbi:MAG: nitroreductase family protein [Bacteroidales bacterium]|nr:nitroreductase family protein [Bacteroidales bacterium]MCF8334709.1 nitroreductase family protein [Bacteroidales bacterium]
MKNKEAKTKYPIHPNLKKRWSPRAFDEKPVEKDKIRRLFEALRWTPSSYNQQPWRLIIGFKGDETYTLIMDALSSRNQSWAINAPVLIAVFGRKFQNNSEDNNKVYQFDVGQSMAYLTVQAMEENLYVHQMAGIKPEKMVENFEVPVQYKPLTAAAIGYIGDPEILPENMYDSEIAERTRFDFDEIIFSGKFGRKSSLFEK